MLGTAAAAAAAAAAFVPRSTVPAAKKVLHKCRPNYSKVHFATTGFEGITSTDEEVASLATVEIQVVEEGEEDAAVGSSHSGSSSSGKKKRRKRHGNARMGAYKDTVTTVLPSQSSQDVPTATAAAMSAQEAKERVCRHSKRWSAC